MKMVVHEKSSQLLQTRLMRPGKLCTVLQAIEALLNVEASAFLDHAVLSKDAKGMKMGI